MKDFDLEAALSGEPVMLRDGRKAVVLIDCRAVNSRYGCNYGLEYPLKGVIIGEGQDWLSWTADGRFSAETRTNSLDIVGMWG